VKEFEEIFGNMVNNSQSDVLISYGNNNYASKILMESIIKNYEDLHMDEEICQVDVKRIYFNSFIHSSEDMILKKICNELEIDTYKAGYTGHRSAIEEYYKNCRDKKNKIKKVEGNPKYLVIFFDNVDYLFQKKKQILFYTLLEIVNISHNIVFCGLTSNFNLLELMEKRIRSRFSQKTIFLRVNDFQNIIGVLETIFKQESKADNDLLYFYNEFILNDQDESPDVENDFFNYNMIILIEKYVNLGLSIKEILTKLQYIISLVILAIKEKYPNNEEIIEKDQISIMIKEALTEYVNEELDGCYYNVLKSKF
jgi:Cdc6-like AAA superfamily ATPase